MTEYSIRVKDVTKSFKTSRKIGDLKEKIIKAIDNISMDVEKGQMIGIIGRNGSGKTTLLRLIA